MQRPTHDRLSDVCGRIVRRVAETTDTDPVDVERLYASVDPDCLDRLFDGTTEHARNRGLVRFPLHGCDVTVHADGTVEVDPHRASLDSDGPTVADRRSRSP